MVSSFKRIHIRSLSFLKVNQHTGHVNYKMFLELIAPEVPRRSHDKEISEYALAKMSPILARCPVLLKSNPLREKKQHKETPVVEYENIFLGAFVNLRKAPSVSSPVVGTLTRGQRCHATATRGGGLHTTF